MPTSWRKAVVVVLGAASVAALIYARALAKKPGGGGGDGATPPGTVFFVDKAEGFSGGEIDPHVIGMNADGSGKFLPLPWGVLAQPSNRTYGEDGHRWWLTVAEVPDEFGDIHRELYAVSPDSTDPTDPDKLTWVKLTDFFDATYEDGQSITIFANWLRWSNDGADSFVSFKGHDNRDDTDNIYRLPVKGTDLESPLQAPYGPDDPDVEVVLTIPKELWWDGTRWKHCETLGEFTWSPDGTELAFVVVDSREAFPHTLWVKSVGSGQSDLGTPVWVGQWTRANTLGWSPDGSRIVFVGQIAPSYGDIAIRTVTPDGLETVVRYYRSHGLSGESYSQLGWSPDGQYIVMTVTKGGTAPPWTRYIGISPIDRWQLTLLTNDLDPATGKVPVAWVP